ncbi:MFS transporter [Paenibacillus brasilensis]|uniref:MFS family permease n=1 Tax=Paenibacillus brasilensis TaxID=128574 RepID=A0ABU0KYB4_9BACL|nr:MFS transporter [Paenibacillus brasilensis]MDQ0494433.1 MFS family permease [Paenibacillus brasilensis]
MTEFVGKVKLSSEKNYPLMTAILVWCALVVVSSLYITLPMASVFASTFKVTPEIAAWTSSAFSFAYAVGFLLFGPLSDQYGRKQLMLSGLVALLFITPLLGLMTSLSGVIALRAVQGLAAATFGPSALAYVVEVFPLKKRVTTVGFVSTGFLMAGIAGQIFSSLITQNLGWSYVFYILGVLYFLSIILLSNFLPKGEARGTEANVLTPFKQMVTVLFRKPLFFCYLITVTLLLSFVGMYTTLGNYLPQAPFVLTANQMLTVRAAGILGMILSPFAGRLVARYGLKPVLQAGLILGVAGLTAIGISSNLPVLIGMSVVFVAGISITVPTLILLIGNLAGEARGAAVTLYTFILFIGATLGPIIALNLQKTGNYVLTMESFALLLAVAFCLSYFVKIQGPSEIK